MNEPNHAPGRSLARKLVVDLAIMTVIGVVLALIGPFGSAGAPFALRLVTWLGFAYLGYAVYAPMQWVVDRLERALHLPRIGLWIGAVLVATVPMAAMIWCIGFLPGTVPWPSAEQALTTYGETLVIGASVTVIVIMAGGSRRVPVAPVATTSSSSPDPEPSRFLDRLPPHLGSELIALQMEDHYVRAHTALGSDLILLRMRDAVAELAGINGAQVHRSWWVARDAVEDVRRDGRNIQLVLTGGLEAPVSRNNAAALKDAGWF